MVACKSALSAKSGKTRHYARHPSSALPSRVPYHTITHHIRRMDTQGREFKGAFKRLSHGAASAQLTEPSRLGSTYAMSRSDICMLRMHHSTRKAFELMPGLISKAGV